MRLNHIAYRVNSRVETAEFFEDALNYRIAEEFDINFDDGSGAKCIVMKPPYYAEHEIFISDGTEDSIVGKWVKERSGVGGIHHLAYEVDDVEATMLLWKNKGLATFQTKEPLRCPGLTQIFTHPHPLTGVIYELIKREVGNSGFCKDNVKKLMLASDNELPDDESQNKHGKI